VYLDERDQAIPVEVEVTKIAPHSTAARIKLKAGDRLLSYDGELLRSTDQLLALIGKGGPGIEQLTYRRGQMTFSAQVRPGRLGVFLANARAGTPGPP
jgi:S1-C subfamily serine protease